MQLPSDMKIAGWKTVNDWEILKKQLADYNDTNSWESAYIDFFLRRLEDRYLDPIRAIKENGSYSGEGFSIMAIICSLVEFLESTYQGICYRYVKKSDPPLGTFEYSGSSDIFVSFLTNRAPFATAFNMSLAEEFYKNVRCGLLHEARTKGKWTIWGTASTKMLVDVRNTELIVYRDNFFDALNTFIQQFKIDLLSSTDRKAAFIRKFDNLCEE